ncbi:MAG TPA: DinB family protein [Candidatus Binatia bacterium]|nr:DinB family protein [Candidatus Binatia bacterium]
MQKVKWITILAVWLTAGNLLAQAGRQVVDTKDMAPLDAQREKHALQALLRIAEKEIIPAVEAMPADKFGFAPTDGEFKGVRTFGQMVKHLSATNYILAAAALGEQPPADAGDELGPETVRTKTEILNYLNGSFAQLYRATEAIGQLIPSVNASPISPLKQDEITRSGLIVESLMHAYDHYGQMVEYLRMNGVVPPASRP